VLLDYVIKDPSAWFSRREPRSMTVVLNEDIPLDRFRKNIQ